MFAVRLSSKHCRPTVKNAFWMTETISHPILSASVSLCVPLSLSLPISVSLSVSLSLPLSLLSCVRNALEEKPGRVKLVSDCLTAGLPRVPRFRNSLLGTKLNPRVTSHVIQLTVNRQGVGLGASQTISDD